MARPVLINSSVILSNYNEVQAQCDKFKKKEKRGQKRKEQQQNKYGHKYAKESLKKKKHFVKFSVTETARTPPTTYEHGCQYRTAVMDKPIPHRGEKTNADPVPSVSRHMLCLITEIIR